MKDTYEFADTLLKWIKDILTRMGMSAEAAQRLEPAIYLVLIVIIAFVSGYVIHKLIAYFVKKIVRYKKVRLFQVLLEDRVSARLARLIPPIILLMLLPFVLDNAPRFMNIVEKITWIYFVLVVLDFINELLSSIWGIFSSKSQLRDRPMKGLVQIIQVFLSFMAIIVIISLLVNKSPFNLITGLGAFAAVLLLIFRDSILGFVAGVQLSRDDMVRIGDWIEMPSSGVNGVVMDISLNTVKVQNFDNTIVTVPPYSLISDSFKNWRGMEESGGRRIMRSYLIDLNTVQFCTDEYLEEMKKIDLLKDYITQKQAEQAAGRVANTENPHGLVNGTIETNLGLFRAYMTLYLQQHVFITSELILMVRTLDPTVNGLPLQVYCFSANKDWVSYESIQDEIMEHFAAILPRFGLYPFQNASGRDYINSSIIEAGGKAEQLTAIPWGTYREHPQNPSSDEKPSKN